MTNYTGTTISVTQDDIDLFDNENPVEPFEFQMGEILG